MFKESEHHNALIGLSPETKRVALSSAKLVEKAYIKNLDCSPNDPLNYFSDEGIFGKSFVISTETGVNAWLNISQGNLQIGIAGTNSWGDWLININHLKDSLINCWQQKEFDSSYKLSYETLAGYVFDYLNFYDHLAAADKIAPVSSIIIGGHSAGGRVADWLAYSLANRYRRQIPLDLCTFASPQFKEFYSCKRLEAMNIRLSRYAIANDLISQLPGRLFNCDRIFTQVLPAIAPWKRPHRLQNFINYFQD